MKVIKETILVGMHICNAYKYATKNSSTRKLPFSHYITTTINFVHLPQKVIRFICTFDCSKWILSPLNSRHLYLTQQLIYCFSAPTAINQPIYPQTQQQQQKHQQLQRPRWDFENIFQFDSAAFASTDI